jgi:hypothetical protein
MRAATARYPQGFMLEEAHPVRPLERQDGAASRHSPLFDRIAVALYFPSGLPFGSRSAGCGIVL